MPQNSNPYQSPQSIKPGESWWNVFTKRILFWWTIQEPGFQNGDALLYAGIVFFVDPQEPNVLFAATPSADSTQRRLNLVVSETVRVLPMFLAENPQIEPYLVGRQLKVRLIHDYQNFDQDYSLEYEFEWDVLTDFLTDTDDELEAEQVEHE